MLEGVQSARLSQSLFADIASLERTVRLYQVLGDAKVLDGYRRTDQSLAAHAQRSWRCCSTTNPRAAASKNSRRMHNEIANAVELHAARTAPPSPRSSRASTALNELAKDDRRQRQHGRSTRAWRNCSGRPRARSAGCSGSPRCWCRSP